MSYDLSKLSVLVVEDNPHMRRLIKEILSVFMVREVHDFEDPRSAIASFADQQYDLALVDWLMEPVDGLQLVNWVRNSGNCPDPYLPIIIVSAYSESKRVEAARDAGVNEFLVKPLAPATLYNKICALIDNPRSFVRADSYFGPDRRRLQRPEMRLMKRRKEDEAWLAENPDEVAQLEERHGSALSKLRHNNKQKP